MKSLNGDGLLHVLDMMIHERIYLSTYHSLNDIDEGNWAYENSPDLHYLSVAKPVRKLLERQRFTSFIRSINNPLMWAHYAGGFSGVALEYDLDLKVLDIRKIDYIGDPKVSLEDLKKIANRTILPQDIGILRSKAPCWKYEDEWRLYGNSKENYLRSTKLKALIFGIKGESIEYDLLKTICDKFKVQMGYLAPLNTGDLKYQVVYV